MVFVHYKNDQLGPTYVVHLTVTQCSEAEYLTREGDSSLQVIMQRASDIVHIGKQKSISYENICSTDFYIASIFPDTSLTEFNSQEVVVSWTLQFSTGEPFCSPSRPSQMKNETKWWTITLLRGQLTPSSELEIVLRFDCCTGESPLSPVHFPLVENKEVDFSSKLEKYEGHRKNSIVYCQVDIPTIGTQEQTVDGDPLVVLPMRRKKAPWRAAIKSHPILSEPEYMHMFDESIVVLPKKT